MKVVNQNLKLLRTSQKFSQAQFGKLFNVKRELIESLENKGTKPDTGLLIEICKYFNLDLERFYTLDMTLHDVTSKAASANSEGREQTYNHLMPGLDKDARFEFLKDIDPEKLKALYVKTVEENDQLKVDVDLQRRKIILLQDENIRLREDKEKG
ncbi:MAG: helix-turn-helix transcriptional regulator [Bacteroidota bacterium]